jgi:hypothetical protein
MGFTAAFEYSQQLSPWEQCFWPSNKTINCWIVGKGNLMDVRYASKHRENEALGVSCHCGPLPKCEVSKMATVSADE